MGLESFKLNFENFECQTVVYKMGKINKTKLHFHPKLNTSLLVSKILKVYTLGKPKFNERFVDF